MLLVQITEYGQILRVGSPWRMAILVQSPLPTTIVSSGPRRIRLEVQSRVCVVCAR
jgi:hypothetical protein